LKDVTTARKNAGLPGKSPVYTPYVKTVTYLLPTTPESDFPISYSPNLVPCGGIFLPSPPLHAIDPELETWLKAKPTVLVNLGSFLKPDRSYIRELAKAIKALFDCNPEVQVLWKLDFQGAELPEEVVEFLSTEISSQRLMIQKWLKVEPAQLVLSGLITLVVHHGGANTFFEVVR
jgi:hypothetical protein